MYRIKIDRSRCIGCLTCVTACVVSHESNDARNRVVIDSEGNNLYQTGRKASLESVK